MTNYIYSWKVNRNTDHAVCNNALKNFLFTVFSLCDKIKENRREEISVVREHEKVEVTEYD